MAWSDEQKKRTFQVWSDMKQRCYNPKSKQFNNYGRRGISVCDRWKDSFENFFSDMGYKPEGLTLDRADNNGNYSPENCRWVSIKEQNNNKRDCIYIEFGGEKKTLTQWAEHIGIHYSTLKFRISEWGLEKALTTPREDKYAARSQS